MSRRDTVIIILMVAVLGLVLLALKLASLPGPEEGIPYVPRATGVPPHANPSVPHARPGQRTGETGSARPGLPRDDAGAPTPTGPSPADGGSGSAPRPGAQHTRPPTSDSMEDKCVRVSAHLMVLAAYLPKTEAGRAALRRQKALLLRMEGITSEEMDGFLAGLSPEDRERVQVRVRDAAFELENMDVEAAGTALSPRSDARKAGE